MQIGRHHRHEGDVELAAARQILHRRLRAAIRGLRHRQPGARGEDLGHQVVRREAA
jgi:hypothetical protein